MQHLQAHIFDFTPHTLTDWCVARAMPAYRAKQILEWVYAKGVIEPARMSNLSAADRALLAHPSDGLTFLSGDTVRRQTASDGTEKLLIQWANGGTMPTGGMEIAPAAAPLRLRVLGDSGSSGPDSLMDSSRQTECVMIPAEPIARANTTGMMQEWNGDDDDDNARSVPTHDGPVHRRRTACISSQVGCPVGCRFCASGIGGLDGNLSAGRIVEQVWRLARLPGVERITNVVFMGMGEPLSNFQSVMKAVRTIVAPWGMGISARKVTISTVGLPRAIERLADELDLPVTLALSLHAPNDQIRRSLIPWAEYTTIPELTGACQKWFDKTGREITLEYILLRGVNDRPEHARELAAVARTLRANINLIRYNEVAGMPFGRPADEDVLVFQALLREARVNVHIRASRGRDIAAACGQLRHDAATEGALPASAAASRN